VTNESNISFSLILFQLDAKKSPLALLAQTCSQIGADPPSTKTLLSSLHTSTTNPGGENNNNNNNNASGRSSSNSQSKRKSENHRSKHHNSNVATSSPHHDDHSGQHKTIAHSSSPKSPSNLRKSSPFSKQQENCSTTRVSPHSNSNAVTLPATISSANGRSNSNSSSSSTTVVDDEVQNAAKVTSNANNASPSSSCGKTGSRSTTPAESVANNLSKPQPQGSPKNSSLASQTSSSAKIMSSPNSIVSVPSSNCFSYPAGLLSSSSTASNVASSNASNASIGTGIPPYLHSYARLKAAAAAGAENYHSHHSNASLGSVCRDPFCTGCTLGASGHLNSLAAAAAAAVSTSGSKCSAGCTQCDHHKSTIFGGFPFFPGFPPLPPSLASLYSRDPQSNTAVSSSASTLTLTPYICNWIAGDNYCGKKFASSEELLQHLRSHTSLTSMENNNSSSSSAVAAAAAAAAAMERYGLPMGTMGGALGPPHHHPLLSSLSRTYPTPPLSPLSSARFHPYSKPGSMGLGIPPPPSLGSMGHLGSSFGPPGLPPSLASHPLSPFYPYSSLYSQRLGASGLGLP